MKIQITKHAHTGEDKKRETREVEIKKFHGITAPKGWRISRVSLFPGSDGGLVLIHMWRI